MVLFITHSKRFQTVCQFDFSFASRSAMNPIENNVLVRTCKMCFKRKKITSVLGSGEVFFQEPYQCISCCFKPVQVVQQRSESSSKNIEKKVDAKYQPSKNTSTETRNIIQRDVKVVKGEILKII